MLVRALPMRAGVELIAWASRLVGPWLRQNRRALENLAIAFPDRSAAERMAIARAMWANMGRTFAETFYIDRIIAEPSRFTITDEAGWRERMSGTGPSVGVTAHIGNWELAVWPVTTFGARSGGRLPAPRQPLSQPAAPPASRAAVSVGPVRQRRRDRSRQRPPDGAPSRRSRPAERLDRLRQRPLRTPRAGRAVPRSPHAGDAGTGNDRAPSRRQSLGRAVPPDRYRQPLPHRHDRAAVAAHRVAQRRHQDADDQHDRHVRGLDPREPGTVDVVEYPLGGRELPTTNTG